ncbi:MAG: hypothetical protein JXA64_07400 [Candidatus Fermentibacteraceae bacterium]|nr:hypothetical protein [Candidatus Fermentibacteraceae bacterium]MBN2608926.1 hypothetical protein [Candidatus Fermentibacteraceae bacterium]
MNRLFLCFNPTESPAGFQPGPGYGITDIRSREKVGSLPGDAVMAKELVLA